MHVVGHHDLPDALDVDHAGVFEAVDARADVVLGESVALSENLVEPLPIPNDDGSVNRIGDEPSQQTAPGLRSPPHGCRP